MRESRKSVENLNTKANERRRKRSMMQRSTGRFLRRTIPTFNAAVTPASTQCPPQRRAFGGAVRPRRRPGRLDATGGTVGGAVSPPAAVMDDEKRGGMLSPSVFASKASQLLTKLDAALQPLVPLNAPHMLVTRGEHHADDAADPLEEGEDEAAAVQGEYLLIDCGPTHGHYQIQIDTEQQLLVFVSPISGQRIYQYHTNNNNNEDGGQWCCVEDGHNFEGLLVRDLIRHIQGVPQL